MIEPKDSPPENNSEHLKTEHLHIPERHKTILDERLKEFEKNPNRGRSFKEFKEELISKALV
jgi:hypothetical protein